MKRCHHPSTRIDEAPTGSPRFAIRCTSCRALLAVSDGPRDEVYADL